MRCRYLILSSVVFVTVSACWGAEKFEPDRLEKEVLVNGCADALEMEVLADGRILFIERHGTVKMYQPYLGVDELGTVPTAVFGEVGMMGLAVDRDFAKTGWVYLFFCPKEKTTTMRVSRFTIQGDKLLLESEKKLLEFRIDGPDAAIHMGGGLAMDSKGNLYIGTGDNSPPIPELPVDQRPGQEIHDAQRTAANSKDFRGKILRIHPEPDGTYTIPKDNLFADGKDGLPEIYCMGCRNPFRVMIDPRTDWLYWGDVGQNVIEEIKVGPNGYDEINQCRKAGNYGWPMFTGPNEPYSEFDFATRKPGRQFDVNNPENRSRNNTGLKKLPPPQPAFIWYPTEESKLWPMLGSGGRSGMAGPTNYFDSKSDSKIRLPEEFDHTFFIYEWMRNWIMAVKLDADGKLVKIEPFAPHMNFRRPIDMRIGLDGALYVLEYGDKWSGNTDGQIVRIGYIRGHRGAVAVLEADATAGKQPLRVTFDARKSYSKDNDRHLKYTWSIVGGGMDVETGPQFVATFDTPGRHIVSVRVVDSQGFGTVAREDIIVGNAPPKVRFTDPVNGGFFDWDQPERYRVEVEDEEDGSTAKGTIPPERVIVRADYQVRRKTIGDEGLHPGLALMRKTTCFACHTTEGQSKGPPYQSVAQKYKDQKDAREVLAKKIISGGTGVWGAYPMPPHPQHTLEQTRLMVDWVLGLVNPPPLPSTSGTSGAFVPSLKVGEFPTGYPDSGVQLLTASYTDNGTPEAPPLTGEAVLVLHARKKKAAYHDFGRGVQVVDDLEMEHGMIAWLAGGDYLGFAEMNLAGIDRISARAGSRTGTSGTFEIRLDKPDGPRLAKFSVDGPQKQITVPIQPPEGVHDLYIVAIADGPATRKTLYVNWLEFLDSPQAAEARKEARAEARRRLEARKSETKARSFVRSWIVDELHATWTESKQKYSPERGQKLFQELSCIGCHRLGKEGGTVGPDLTYVMQRMSKQPDPRKALLIEIVEPSKVVDEKYRTHLITLTNGEVLAGIIVSQDDKSIRVAANPAKPDEIRTILKSRIEQMNKSDVSLMPVGLLNTLTKEEILDLLAYLESGGKK